MDIDIPVFGGVYVILMMIMGQFFLMNLILAVIIFSFIKSQQDELKSQVEAYHKEEKMKETIMQEEVDIMHSQQSSLSQLSKESGSSSIREEKKQTKDEVKKIIDKTVIALGTNFKV
jgi:flagellar biosynthesis/type III secretory pathway M-ring protein FliF/YscJ